MLEVRRAQIPRLRGRVQLRLVPKDRAQLVQPALSKQKALDTTPAPVCLARLGHTQMSARLYARIAQRSRGTIVRGIGPPQQQDCHAHRAHFVPAVALTSSAVHWELIRHMKARGQDQPVSGVRLGTAGQVG